jgi:hypothetical protein
LSAVAEHGEPPGLWWGPGAAELGLEPGTEIDGEVFEKLYETFLDPRDPDFLNDAVPDAEKARLGRRKSKFTPWKEIYAKALEAEPEAGPERKKELEIEAKKGARQNVIHHDATFSPAKSVTLVHAGLLAAAQKAEDAGQIDLATQYRDAAKVVEDGVMLAAESSLKYLREHAGEARTGYHGVKVAGRTTGRWTEAGGWVVGRFFQHTNREGEPQLHVHQAILNRQLCKDGKWRGLDGMAIYRVRPAAAAHGERVLEEFLTRRLGLQFRSRGDGQGREVVGVTVKQIMAFSSRRAQVLEGTAEAAGLKQRIIDYKAAHGRDPSPRVLFQLAQEATKATKGRKPKAKDAPSPRQELEAWEAQSKAKEVGLLSKIPAAVLNRINPARAQQAAAELAQAELDRVLHAAITDAQEAKSTFTRYELTRYINRHLPDYLGGLDEERVNKLLEQLTDMALAPEADTGVVLLTAPEEAYTPERLRRADGRSWYQAQACERYTTVDQLDAETALTQSALSPGAPRLEPERATELIGLTVEQARQALLEGRAVPEVDGFRPFEDQGAAIHRILTSGRRVDVLQGAAGTGKSFTVSRLAELWRQETGAPALGLTTSQNAAGVLKGEGLDDAWNITRWLLAIDEGETSLQPGQLIVVDEASMVTTDHLAKIQQLADAAGAKVVWAGDSAQLTAPGAGGAMRHVVELGGAAELTTVVRFRNQWERDASLQLRDGLPEALLEYDAHGRLRQGTREEMEAGAYRAYLADYLAGKQTLLLAPTGEKAAELSARVRAELVALGKVASDGVELHDGNTAGRGDLIMARRNVIDQETRLDELTNRDVIRVSSIDAEGRIFGRIIDDKGRPGRIVELEPRYIREHVELAYAGTVHAAEGRTVETCHSVVDESGTRQMLYVMLTRGADGNWAWVVIDNDRASDLRAGPEQSAERGRELLRDQAGAWTAAPEALEERADQSKADRFTVMSAVLETDEADQMAVEAMVEEGERPRHMAVTGSEWIDQIREGTADAYLNRAVERGSLTPEQAASARSDEAKGTLGRLLRELEMAGMKADEILDAAIAERELETAESIPKTLHWRINRAAEERGIDLNRVDVDETQVRGTWRERTPHMGDPDTDRFLTERADLMDYRTHELGQAALDSPPAWLVEEMGAPHADDVIERGMWAERAGRVMAYREQYGHASDTDPIGAPPSRRSPEQRAAWFAAHDALGSPDRSREVTGATLGQLWTWRAAYERDSRWAPPHVADELGKVTGAADDRERQAVRLRAQARSIEHTDPAAAAALNTRAQGQETLAAALRERQGALQEIHEARQAWDAQTRDTRVLATRADAELRRRPSVDPALLPPLHLDQDEARERIEAQRQAEAAQAAERAVPEGQTELDLGSAEVDRATAWQPTPTPEIAEPPELAEHRRRLEWVERELDRARAERNPESVVDREQQELLERNRNRLKATIADLEWQHRQATKNTETRDIEPAAAPQPDRQAEAAQATVDQEQPEAQQMRGQVALDLFDEEGQRVDRDEQPELADALDKARAARTIAEVRQADHAAELGQDAEAEQRRRQAERSTPDIDERAVERTEHERARLDERTARARAAREHSPTLAREDFPRTVEQAIDATREQEQAYEPPQYEPPSYDRGPELGM